MDGLRITHSRRNRDRQTNPCEKWPHFRSGNELCLLSRVQIRQASPRYYRAYGVRNAKKVDLYLNMSRLFSNDGDYVSINLASAYDHLINKSTLALAPGMRDAYVRSLLATPAKLADKIEEFDPVDEKIRPKYVWIKDKIDELIANEEQTFLKA